MPNIIKTKYRYPIFFIGVMLLIASGIFDKYLHVPLNASALLAGIGFILIVASLSRI